MIFCSFKTFWHSFYEFFDETEYFSAFYVFFRPQKLISIEMQVVDVILDICCRLFSPMHSQTPSKKANLRNHSSCWAHRRTIYTISMLPRFFSCAESSPFQ